MRSAPLICVLTLPLFLGLGGCVSKRGSEPTPAATPATKRREQAGERMGEALARAVAEQRVRGVALWWEQDGRVIRKTEGVRTVSPQSEPMTADTIFDSASLTKVLATTPAIMQLVERRKIGLDDPVEKHLPGLRAGGKVTIRHLMTHVSGLPAGLDPAGWTGHDEGLRRAKNARLEDEPGEVFRYSDINFILLGAIVEKTDGRRLDTYCVEEIFKPLGMNDTGFAVPAEKLPRTAPTAPKKDGAFWHGVVHDPTSRNMEGVAGHAGVFTTAADLARFCRMMVGEGQLDGRRILKAESVREMVRPQLGQLIGVQRGLGWDLDTPHSGPRGVFYPKLASYGHTGFTGTSVWIDPGSRSFVVLLTSRLHPLGKGDTGRLRSEIGTLAAEAAGLGR